MNLRILFLIVFNCFRASATETFVTRIPSDPGNLDWNRGGVAQIVVQQIMEGLTTSGMKAEPIPAMAKSWEFLNRNGENKIIFHLSERAQWTDGAPVCASEFEAAWKKVLNPKFASPYAHLLFDLKNAKKFHSGAITDDHLIGITSKGCHTLEVELEKQAPYFVALTSHWVFFPNHEKLDALKLPVTNGPYRIKEWKQEQYYLLEANSKYFGKKPKIESIKVLIVSSDSTALNLYEQGKLHWTKDLPALDIKRLSLTPDFKIFKTYVLYHLGFSGLDQKARCALAYSLNKEQIPVVLESKDSPAYSVVPPSLSSKYKKFQSYNEKLAKKLFQESNFFKTNKKVDVYYYSKDSHQILMEWVTDQWKKNLGIDFNLTKLENKVYWSFLAKTPPQVFLSGTTAEYPHAFAFLSEFFSQSVPNWGKFSSKTFEQQALLSLSDNAAGVLKAQDELLESECAVVPLYFRTTATLVSPRFKGFFMNPLTYVYLKNLTQIK